MSGDSNSNSDQLKPEVRQAIQAVLEVAERWVLDVTAYTTRRGIDVIALSKPGIKGFLFRIQTRLKRGKIPIIVERRTITENYDIEAYHLDAIFDLDKQSSKIYFAPADIPRFISKLDTMFELQVCTEKAQFQPQGNRMPKSHKPRKAIGEYLDGTHDAKIRRDCIKFHGAICSICGLDFGKKYGEVGEGYIEVHHLELKADRDGKYISPIDDLRPVCPNCHRMLHRRDPPYSIQEFLEKLSQEDEAVTNDLRENHDS